MVFLAAAAAVITGCGSGSGGSSGSGSIQAEATALELWDGCVMNPLTGEFDYSADSVGNRPVAVMVNNLYKALPQYGISEADIIFEIPMEAYLTRLLCVYSDYTDVPYIVSVRSYRYYFATIACGFDAIYVHWGQDESMMDYYYSLGMDTYNGMWNSTLFGRDQGRLDSGYDTEHTSYFDGTLLAAQMETDGVRTTLEDEYLGTVFNFNDASSPVTYDGESTLDVNINFGSNTAELVYREDTKTYFKFTAGQAQVDGITGDQLQFENVIVLETDMWVRDDNVHLGVNITGVTDGAGYYITGGTAQPITWAKADEDSQFVFYDASGNELEMNRGKTYIAITRPGTYTIE